MLLGGYCHQHFPRSLSVEDGGRHHRRRISVRLEPAAGLMEDRPLCAPYLSDRPAMAAISELQRQRLPCPYGDDIITYRPGKIPMKLAIKRERTQIINSAVETFGEPDRNLYRFTFWVSASGPSADGWP